MEDLLLGVLIVLGLIAIYTTIVHFVRKRTDLKPLLGVAETTDTLEAERAERVHGKNE